MAIPTIDRPGCSGFHMNWKNKDYRNKQSCLIEDFVHRIGAFLVLVFHMAHTWGVDRDTPKVHIFYKIYFGTLPLLMLSDSYQTFVNQEPHECSLSDDEEEPKHLHDPPILKYIPHLWPGGGDRHRSGWVGWYGIKKTEEPCRNLCMRVCIIHAKVLPGSVL